jgi:hypothetical protein
VTPQKSINFLNIENRRRPLCYPNRLPVFHESCRPGGRPPISLVTPSASTDLTSAIHNVQLEIKDTNLPNINISHLKNCTKVPHDIDI